MIKSIIELNGIPLWFSCFTVLLTIVCGLRTKKWVLSLLMCYLLIILGETLLFRTPNKSDVKLTPFWSYAFPETKSQIIANILLFIPFGLLAGKLWGWKIIPLATFFSFCIEAVQLVFCLGLFEIDDIIHNTVGFVIGYLPTSLYRGIKKRKQ